MNDDVIGRAPKRVRPRPYIPFGTVGRMLLVIVLLTAALAVDFGILLAVSKEPWAVTVAVLGGSVFLAAATWVALGGES
jgi:hypothetical protein